MTRILLFLFGLLLGPALPLAAAEPVTVFAAASLRGALDEIAESHDAPVVLSFGGSGAIARQVANGAPADVIVLANSDWMDWLQSKGRVTESQVRMVTQNRLVVIGPAGADPVLPEALPRLLGDNRLAMGQRQAVPAGKYAQQWLMAAGLWQDLQGSLAETDNVRAALALVARGQTPFGVVYVTDALAEPGVTVVYSIPQDSHSPIQYPAAALTAKGRMFLDHLRGDISRAILTAHGYEQVTP